MGNDIPSDSRANLDSQTEFAKSRKNQISQNIETVLSFYTREEQNSGRSLRAVNRISDFAGSPLFLVCVLSFVSLWIFVNILAQHLGYIKPDPAPFFALQGIISLGAWLTSTVVLIKQNHLTKLEEQRAHLDLQVNLVTEQKVTKLINLIEELRRDLPMVENRHDAVATAYQQPTDPNLVIATMNEIRESEK